MNGTREQKLSFTINDKGSTIVRNTSSITIMSMGSSMKRQYNGENEKKKNLSMNRHEIKSSG